MDWHAFQLLHLIKYTGPTHAQSITSDNYTKIELRIFKEEKV